MANPWFRMYSEFSHDPKVQMLPEAMQRRYVMVMCLRCSDALVTLHETELAFQLRITDAELAETKALFITKGFIDSDWNLLNWEKRQFASDTSKARVAKHRALSKSKQKPLGNGKVTLQKRQANALDTDTDTDTEKKKEGVTPFVLPDWVPEDAWRGYEEMRVRVKKPMTARARVLVIGELTKLRDSGHAPGPVLDRSTVKGWTDVYPLKGAPVSDDPYSLRTAV